MGIPCIGADLSGSRWKQIAAASAQTVALGGIATGIGQAVATALPLEAFGPVGAILAVGTMIVHYTTYAIAAKVGMREWKARILSGCAKGLFCAAIAVGAFALGYLSLPAMLALAISLGVIFSVYGTFSGLRQRGLEDPYTCAQSALPTRPWMLPCMERRAPVVVVAQRRSAGPALSREVIFEELRRTYKDTDFDEQQVRSLLMEPLTGFSTIVNQGIGGYSQASLALAMAIKIHDPQEPGGSPDEKVARFVTGDVIPPPPVEHRLPEKFRAEVTKYRHHITQIKEHKEKGLSEKAAFGREFFDRMVEARNHLLSPSNDVHHYSKEQIANIDGAPYQAVVRLAIFYLIINKSTKLKDAVLLNTLKTLNLSIQKLSYAERRELTLDLTGENSTSKNETVKYLFQEINNLEMTFQKRFLNQLPAQGEEEQDFDNPYEHVDFTLVFDIV